ncbi:recombinase family protein [Chlorogloeopsis sp. ULAP01]|uniref:recombinase family protein n=1 Tax=Chlorogloeopsis sp. ULAP01 TaxID=3056483 RepID=UPI0025AAE647|nr:recombinase family protein [Chlorogloeopsis sp. ULAP01]MDM9382631.1 recombinase family protein [Chlorogloeopsis sp. ULAP01]
MFSHSIWIVGPSRSGKTARLVQQFASWMQDDNYHYESFYKKNTKQKNSDRITKSLHLNQTEPSVLVLAANDENRRELADKIVTTTAGKYPVRCKTPLGFFQDEIILFWPLLIQSLNLKAQFPVRLRPETEQELATKLWRPHLDEEILQRVGVNEYRLVRRILDLLQLAAYGGTPTEEISSVLATALAEQDNTKLEPELLAFLLLNWRNWCLERGLLTYGIITELYSQHLLTNPDYQQRLKKRYQGVLADDVQDYPAVVCSLFEFLLDGGAVGAFSYNPDGVVRLGLGADPGYIEAKLAARTQVKTLTASPLNSLADTLTEPMMELLTEPMALLSLPEAVQSIQTTSRAQLLRQTAEAIANAIKAKQVEPEQVAVIAPGLDAIARYTLIEILTKQGIAVQSLNDQRPLISFPIVRALLTLLALVYPGLGRLLDRDAVAEMLVVLSRGNVINDTVMPRQPDAENENISMSPRSIIPASYPRIDPVRAGLIADYCFQPHPDRPNLLPVTTFDRWDRLGYAATTAYSEILQWLEEQRSQQELRLIPSPISFLDRAIQRFLWNGSNLPYDQLAALRELLETAQHYWEIDSRLRQISPAVDTENKGQVTGDREQENFLFASPTLPLPISSPQEAIADFIQLLRRGTITANPYPIRPIGPAAKAVTFATIFQYRSSRRSHRWHFWLDAGSPLWAKGGAATLFGAPFFLQERLGEPWTAEDEKLAEEQRLRRILADLLSRVSERVYLCHSDLAMNGQEQLGPLLPLVHQINLIE